MVAGHLQEKNGLYYIVLSYLDEAGKRRNKWIATKLPIKGNKKRAEEMLLKARREFNIPKRQDQLAEVLFADYLEEWVEIAKYSIQRSTYASYKNLMNSSILPHFRKLGVTLAGLKPAHIQAYYGQELQRVKAVTVIHYHAIIRRALQYAMKTDLIPTNPADKVERPRKERFNASFYDSAEVNQLFDVVKGHKLELPVLFAAFYGLRRSEAVGLKWNAIDLKQNTITIRHTVLAYNLDGKSITEERDMTKSKASLRTLPLVPAFRERLLRVKEEQAEYRRLCGRCYNTDFLEYICVDEMGNRIKPNYVSSSFGKFLDKHGLRRVRYHDLRHSCASLLLANGVSMKQIQEWLGHSDVSTTANIYAHLDFNSKISSAEALVNGLNLDLGENGNDDTLFIESA